MSETPDGSAEDQPSQNPKDGPTLNGGRPYISILRNESGGVSLVGHIGNLQEALGLLEWGKFELYGFHLKANEPKIVRGGILNFMRGGKRH